jgi:hypothetical protein
MIKWVDKKIGRQETRELREYLLSKKNKNEVRHPFTNSIPSPKILSNSTCQSHFHKSRQGGGVPSICL